MAIVGRTAQVKGYAVTMRLAAHVIIQESKTPHRRHGPLGDLVGGRPTAVITLHAQRQAMGVVTPGVAQNALHLAQIFVEHPGAIVNGHAKAAGQVAGAHAVRATGKAAPVTKLAHGQSQCGCQIACVGQVG